MSIPERGQYARREIINQPVAWQATLDVVDSMVPDLELLFNNVQRVIFTGCGSGLNVSLSAASVLQQLTGIPARAVPAGDCIYFPGTVFSQESQCLVVAVSRSGDTTETVMACRTAQQFGARTLAITCYPESNLAGMADLALVLEGANERAVVTTQSLTSMVLCCQALAAQISGQQAYLEQLKTLPEAGKAIMDQADRLGDELVNDFEITRFAFVGSGAYYGLARECQLKIKEMTLLPSDAYPVLDFRHGPMSNVDEHMLVTLLASDAAKEPEKAFLREMKNLGGKILMLCDQTDKDVHHWVDKIFEANSGLPDFARDILYLPPVHFLSFYRSLMEGQNPDYPVNLDYAVILE